MSLLVVVVQLCLLTVAAAFRPTLLRRPRTALSLDNRRRPADATLMMMEPTFEPQTLSAPPPFEPQSFEAQGDPAQFLLLALVVAIPFGYWWLITVPEARLDLAKDKRKGETKEFIRELQDAEGREAEKWFFSKWLRQTPVRRGAVSAAAVDDEATRTVGAEPSPVATLEPTAVAADADASTTKGAASASGVDRVEEAVQPTLAQLFEPATKKGNPTPKFFSGDNPIVVATSTLLVLGIGALIVRQNGALALDATIVAAGIFFGLTRLDLK